MLTGLEHIAFAAVARRSTLFTWIRDHVVHVVSAFLAIFTTSSLGAFYDAILATPAKVTLALHEATKYHNHRG